MLHAKFQDHRTSGSGKEDFLRFLPFFFLRFLRQNLCRNELFI